MHVQVWFTREYDFFGKEKTNTITSSDKQPRRTEQKTHLRFT